ncbi:peptide deformylase [Synechococcus sp. GFB01]|uniref:peptide deformylase n=1 Tax=Synechococcus sp. GFB01 TaxID=1662190 RepID=UPI00064FC7E5|nr:peptide deformylase [Synechococcus sp. GFB01]KMM17181.1 peptide deformylase [Synechococcus sp. GFB01]
MSVLPVLRLGDPRLREQAVAVEEHQFASTQLRQLIHDLRDTMAARDGAGLAAPQIGVPLQVVIFGISSNSRYPEAPPIPETVLINPVIRPIGQATQLGWEGCLSVPGLRGQVERWQRIDLQWRDPSGTARRRTVTGFEARVVQHECDHLDGVLFPERLADRRAFGFSDELRAAGLL